MVSTEPSGWDGKWIFLVLKLWVEESKKCTVLCTQNGDQVCGWVGCQEMRDKNSVHVCAYVRVHACVCLHACRCMYICTYAYMQVPAILPASKHARVNVTVHKKTKKKFACRVCPWYQSSEYLPFAGLVGAGNSNACVNNAVGIQHLHHFTELFLQVSLKLFVTHWQCVEQILQCDGCSLLKDKRAKSIQMSVGWGWFRWYRRNSQYIFGWCKPSLWPWPGR